MMERFSAALNIETDSVRSAVEAGRKELDSLKEKERFLIENNIVVRPNSPEHTHLRFFQTNEITRDVSRDAAVGLVVAAELANK